MPLFEAHRLNVNIYSKYGFSNKLMMQSSSMLLHRPVCYYTNKFEIPNYFFR
jgi:hypothetical protein